MNMLYMFLSTYLLTVTLLAQPSQDVYVCPPCPADCHDLVFDKPGTCHVCQMQLVKKNDPSIKTIAFYLQEGVEILDFAGPMEVFAYAGHKIFTVTKDGKPIVSQGILKITPDYSVDNVPEADVIAFFGGYLPQEDKQKAIDWINGDVQFDNYFSVCNGAFILAEAGKLDGNVATTFHSQIEPMRKQFKNVDVRSDVRFVDNGKVVTTAGVSAGIDGALHMVARWQGLQKAKDVVFYMEYDNWTPGNGLVLTDDNPYE